MLIFGFFPYLIKLRRTFQIVITLEKQNIWGHDPSALPCAAANLPPPGRGHPQAGSRMGYYLIILVKLVILYFKKVNQNTGWHGVTLSYVTYLATNTPRPWACSARSPARRCAVCNLLASAPQRACKAKFKAQIRKLQRDDGKKDSEFTDSVHVN